jgi:anti-anti-sigma regulatory factor
MLRITVDKNSRCRVIRVEGKLAGPWVEELERTWRIVTAESAECKVSVDLTDVIFVGEEGKRLLELMYEEGAKLKASGCVTRRLVEEIEQTCNRNQPKQTVSTPE